MDTGLFIAARYLFARKSHNVINVISAISAAGMAIGTAALILILSVCNGFDAIIEKNMSDLDPDITIRSGDGGSFVPDRRTVEWLEGLPGTGHVYGVLAQNVLVSYSGKQALAQVRGVDGNFETESGIAGHMVSGEFVLHEGGMPQACVGAALASQMGMNPRFLEKIVLLYPGEDGSMPLLGPASSLRSIRVGLTGVFSIGSEADSRLVIIPVEDARRLLGKADGEVTELALELRSEKDARHLKKQISARLSGEGFTVLDRYELNPSLYRMMRYEKLSVYMILLFVVIIIAFNIFGSMSMLIIEKEQDMATLRAMGARDAMLGKIFVLEGWMISLLGLGAGLVAGTGLALAQQHLGIVKMPGAFSVNAYPAILEAGDVLWTCIGVAATGLLVSLLAARGRKF